MAALPLSILLATGGAAAASADPWVLKTPPGTSTCSMCIDEGSDPPSIVCQVGGLRGRFGVCLPPLLEALGLAGLTHDAKHNRMRAR